MERHRLDRTWQVWRGVLATFGALLFVVAGLRLQSAPITDLDLLSYKAPLVLIAFGLAILCLLVGFPGRLFTESSSGLGWARPVASPAGTDDGDAPCPDCGRIVPLSFLPRHLVRFHEYSGPDARVVATDAKSLAAASVRERRSRTDVEP